MNDIYSESCKLGMAQNKEEIIPCVKFLNSMRYKNFIEIGTHKGGTLNFLKKSLNSNIVIAIDVPDYRAITENEFNQLKNTHPDVSFIHASSHDNKTVLEVINVLNSNTVDFLFIDGDHSYEGAKLDYINYRQFVKIGGAIVFHDIADTPYHRKNNCRVDLLWAQLTGKKYEFICGARFGGIGVLIKDKNEINITDEEYHILSTYTQTQL